MGCVLTILLTDRLDIELRVLPNDKTHDSVFGILVNYCATTTTTTNLTGDIFGLIVITRNHFIFAPSLCRSKKGFRSSPLNYIASLH